MNANPKFRKCDIVWVDGGHTKELAYSDIDKFSELAVPGALVMVDDCPKAPATGIKIIETIFKEYPGINNRRYTVLEPGTRKARSICKGNYVNKGGDGGVDGAAEGKDGKTGKRRKRARVLFPPRKGKIERLGILGDGSGESEL